jgi:hypothetical protein
MLMTKRDLDALERSIEAMTPVINSGRSYVIDIDLLHELIQRLRAAEKNSERYIAWRNGACYHPIAFAKALCSCITPDEIDAAIDAQRGENEAISN